MRTALVGPSTLIVYMYSIIFMTFSNQSINGKVITKLISKSATKNDISENIKQNWLHSSSDHLSFMPIPANKWKGLWDLPPQNHGVRPRRKVNFQYQYVRQQKSYDCSCCCHWVSLVFLMRRTLASREQVLYNMIHCKWSSKVLIKWVDIFSHRICFLNSSD